MSKRSGGKRFHAGAFSLSKKSACGGLLRQKLKKCLRPGAQTPRPPGTGGKRQPCGAKGSVCPVARREACARWREGKRVPGGHLGPKGPKRPEAGQRNHERDR